MFYVIVKGSPEPIIARTWHHLQMVLGELQRLEMPFRLDCGPGDTVTCPGCRETILKCGAHDEIGPYCFDCWHEACKKEECPATDSRRSIG